MGKYGALIPLFCAMVSGNLPVLTKRKLLGLLENASYSARNVAIHEIVNSISAMCSIPEAELAYKSFCQARLALNQSDLVVCRKEAVLSWRHLTNLLLTDFMLKPDKCDQVFFFMFLELADCLRKVYTNEKKHTTAGWFCSFLMRMAKELQSKFLMAKYQAYYVEHLTCTDQLSEALVQAQDLQTFLTDEFGEDYLDWMEDAPDAASLCEELKVLTRR